MFSKGILDLIIDMGLDWMKVLAVESGWVSDNYLAFCCLCKWYYSPFHYIPEYIYEEPAALIGNWYVKNCRDLLSAHDFNTKGKVDELKQRINQIKCDKANPPKLKR